MDVIKDRPIGCGILSWVTELSRSHESERQCDAIFHLHLTNKDKGVLVILLTSFFSRGNMSDTFPLECFTIQEFVFVVQMLLYRIILFQTSKDVNVPIFVIRTLLVISRVQQYLQKSLILSIILITAAVTGIFNYVFFWNVALCGASGVVFAFILLTSFTSFKNGEIPLTFILVAVVFIGQQIYEGVMVQDDISNLSHIIGGIIGAVVGYRLNKKA